MSKKQNDQEKNPKSSKKSTKEAKPKNPNRVNSPYNVAKSEACKQLKKEQIEEIRRGPGQPTLYNEEIAQYVLDRVASTTCGLKTLCKEDPKMPAQDTVNLWRWKHPEFSERYLAAKQVQAHLLAEACEEEAKEKLYYTDASGAERVDAGFTAAQRLLIDTRKWHASKVSPHFYGDKKSIEDIKNQQQDLLEEVLSIRAELKEKNKKEY